MATHLLGRRGLGGWSPAAHAAGRGYVAPAGLMAKQIARIELQLGGSGRGLSPVAKLSLSLSSQTTEFSHRTRLGTQTSASTTASAGLLDALTIGLQLADDFRVLIVQVGRLAEVVLEIIQLPLRVTFGRLDPPGI